MSHRRRRLWRRECVTEVVRSGRKLLRDSENDEVWRDHCLDPLDVGGERIVRCPRGNALERRWGGRIDSCRRMRETETRQQKQHDGTDRHR
jgi:hypothetical protein